MFQKHPSCDNILEANILIDLSTLYKEYRVVIYLIFICESWNINVLGILFVEEPRLQT